MLREGEVPVFWACGVTPQAVAAAGRPDVMITHAPGHMDVTDVKGRRARVRLVEPREQALVRPLADRAARVVERQRQRERLGGDRPAGAHSRE